MAKRLLVIDDDPEFVEAMSNVLDAQGYDREFRPQWQDRPRQGQGTEA